MAFVPEARSDRDPQRRVIDDEPAPTKKKKAKGDDDEDLLP